MDTKILVCDIDNTVANQISRLQRFHDACTNHVNLELAYGVEAITEDKLLDLAVEGVLHFKNMGYKVIWLTARKAHLEEVTRTWLTTNGFPVDELILVEKLADKISIIQDLNPAIVVDDCQYNLENLDPMPATMFIQAIQDMGINLEVFKNNWAELMAKYTN